MGPRYIDPETADELGTAGEARPGILYFANTSTMEYQLERFGETVGLGSYDLQGHHWLEDGRTGLVGRRDEGLGPGDLERVIV